MQKQADIYVNDGVRFAFAAGMDVHPRQQFRPMVASVVVVSFCILLSASAAQAATIVSFTGNSTGNLATGTATITLAADGTSISGTLTNTSPHDAQITGFGFNLSDLFVTMDSITQPDGADFDFQYGALGNVPQFNSAELGFGYLTGKNFSGGSPNDGLDNFETLSFLINGSFAGLNEADIASSLLVRFQRVGANGNGSDVAAANLIDVSVVPEPGSMLLLGTGLAYLARRRLRRTKP